ncbi:hypothetical protein JCM9533A_41570 [Catenuloplanes niger JCM 9533]
MRGVTEVVRRQLAEEGIPPFSDLFVPDIQDSAEPLLTDFYVLGREEDCGRVHGDIFLPECGCGYFGLRSSDGTVWEIFPGQGIDPLPVNSSLGHFAYFLNTLGAARHRYEGLPDKEMIPKYSAVLKRLASRDPVLGNADSFWGYHFARPFG